MHARLALLALLAATAASCKHDATPVPPAAAQSPVPAPATLIAEGTLSDPDGFWGRLRTGGGGGFARLPESAAGAVLVWAGADPTLAPLVSGTVPFQLALGDTADGVGFALAMKLVDLHTVRQSLVESETAPYQAEEVDGMLRLRPRQASPSRFALGITWSGYLVVASSDAELASLGAYAARTLPTKALPHSSFELRMETEALEREGNQAPSFAAKVTDLLAAAAAQLLPPEVSASAFAACFTPGLKDTVATASDLAHARLDVDATESRLDVVAILEPKPGDNGARKRLAAMRPADGSALLESPAEAMAALFWSDTAQSRMKDAATLGPCVGRALAPVLGSGGDGKLADVAQSWARGRGDWQVASFVAKPDVAGLVLRAPVADGGAASASVRGFAELTSELSFADAIRRWLPLRAGGIDTADVPRVGKASIVMFPSHPPVSRGQDDPTTPSAPLVPPGLAWAVDGKEIDVGLGQSPKELLALTRPTSTLRTTKTTAHAIEALGAELTFAAMIAPPGCCKGEGATAAPLTLGWGRRGSDGRATLAIGDNLLGMFVAQLVP